MSASEPSPRAENAAAPAANLVFSPAYNTDLPAYGLNKPFALDRGELVLQRLNEELSPSPVVLSPEPFEHSDLNLVHTTEYLAALENEETWLTIFELTKNELNQATRVKPLTAMIDDFLLKSGGTLLAARQALKTGLAANLGGGYHHAHADHGSGFCVINDIALTIRKLQSENLIERALIIDLDFHQGDGDAAIFANDDSVFTFSVHSQEGWPDEKKQSDLDVGIYEKDKEQYLERTRAGMEQAFASSKADLVVFVAGSDTYEKDVLPGTRFLRLPLKVLQERDEMVIDACRNRGIPMVMVFAGGYGPHVWEVHHLAVRHLLLRSGYSLNSPANP